MVVVLHQPDKLVLRVHARDSLLNALRRSVNEIPVLAIQEVEFIKNDSALYDEMLAHRFGLVPIRTEKKIGATTEITLKLVKKGPCTVYSGDLEGNAEVVYKNIPLVTLERDQELEIIASARLGQATSHAKHMPGLFFYRQLSIVQSKDPAIERLVQHSKGFITPEKTKEGWLCDLNESLLEQVERMDKSALKESDEFLIIVESYGSMDSAEIFTHALHGLGKSLDELAEALS